MMEHGNSLDILKGKYMQNQIKVSGFFSLEVFNKGILTKSISINNRVVNNGLSHLAMSISGGSNLIITDIGFGTSGDETLPNTLNLENKVILPYNTVSYPQSGQALFRWTLPENIGNGIAIREFGLFLSDGSLFSRLRINPEDPAISKTSDISLSGQWLLKLETKEQ